jgi:hypothetical protein
MSTNAKNFLIIYLIMVNLLIFDIINQIFYMCLSKREFQIEIWTYLDLFLFIFAWLLIVDTKEFTGEYKDYEIIEGAKDILWSIQLPFLKELKAEDPTFSTHMSFWFRETILIINNILVWCRLAGFLLTNKTMGPVIRMIFAMTKLLIKYIIIIVIFLACCGGIFTAIFNRESTQFKDFSTSVVTLFGGFLNTFDCYKFDDSSFYFGSVILLIYVCIAAVLFVNILIAILSNVFEDLMKSVDASHRAVIIHYYKKLRREEGEQIEMMLKQNDQQCPVYVVNMVTAVNDDLIAFDASKSDFMPASGTYVHLRDTQFLLYNNERYSDYGKADILFPIKLTITSANTNTGGILTKEDTIDIITQVYQFCRLYWKSVKMQNVPITIAYPEFVAEYVPHFNDEDLPEFGKHNLWML